MKKFRSLLLLILFFAIIAGVYLSGCLITLNEDRELHVCYGEPYVDPGAKVPFGSLKIENNVDPHTMGEYTVTYSSLLGKKTRTVIVEDLKRPEIVLNGPEKIYLVVGDTYQEPGCIASDEIDGDITSNVEISGSAEINTPGEYTISYIVSDKAGNAARTRRSIIVSEKGPLAEDLLEFDLTPFYYDTICSEKEYDEDKYKKILFYGDSFIGNLGDYGVVDYSQLCSRGSTNTDDYLQLPMTIQGIYDGYSGFTAAMERLKPETVVFMLNNDWTSRWTPEYLNESCKKAYSDLKNNYPETRFIILSLMPVSSYYDSAAWTGNSGFSRNDRINKMNTYMCMLCREFGFKFMNAAECIKDPATGAAETEFSDPADGIHLTKAGYEKLVRYIKDHMDW